MVQTANKLFDLETGLASNLIYSDEELYQQERERVFKRCWLFVGHDSMLPNPGDYVTNYMGEDAVIVCRDTAGKPHVFLNKCRHRGNKVCLFDRGHTPAFTCSYHGWSYNTEGKLVGVPFLEDAYLGALDKEKLGLIEAPRVESCGGLIFACWDANVMSLDDYLGDIRWYLDNFFSVEYLGGLQVLTGKQRVLAPINWKLLAENFHGDHYHFYATHASVVKVRNMNFAVREGKKNRFEVTAGYRSGVPHGLGQLTTGTDAYEQDLRQAEQLGPEAVEWVKERNARILAHLKDSPAQAYGFNRGNIFPNFSLLGASSALAGRLMYLWHPTGACNTESWEMFAVEQAAPEVVKKAALRAFAQGQSAGGMVGVDDFENFERISDNVHTPVAQNVPFHYGMGIGHEENFPGRAEWGIEEFPGFVGNHMTEVNQRQFLRYWAELMSRA